MIFLLAGFLANICAWCIHIVTWWLREKCLWLIGSIGSLCILYYSFAVIVITSFGYWNELWPLGLLGLLTLFAASRQASKVSKDNSERPAFMFFGACFTEVTLAILVWNAMPALSQKVSSSVRLYDSFGAKSVEFWFFWPTLFILALIRPQVVKAQKWLWQQVKPQSATNE